MVKITEATGRSGGTGFYVQTPSNKTYILTNAHVCSLKKDGVVYIHDADEIRALPARVLEESAFTDLCLIESPTHSKRGLVVGDEVLGKIVYTIGFPLLMPVTLSQGELIGTQVVQVMDAEDKECNKPKNKQAEVDFGFFKFTVCVIEVNAYLSNIPTLPGNSGSPLVDQYGKVIGVVFAGNSIANWGLMITLKDVKEFLKPY